MIKEGNQKRLRYLNLSMKRTAMGAFPYSPSPRCYLVNIAFDFYFVNNTIINMITD